MFSASAAKSESIDNEKEYFISLKTNSFELTAEKSFDRVIIAESVKCMSEISHSEREDENTM